MAVVSIIICTCNRASDLCRTLEAIGRLSVPADLPCELLVVDNGSTDGTAEIVEAAPLLNMPVHYIYEARRGKGYAYNRGMAEANGDIFLFTDDDVRPPKNWISGMCEPIRAGRADAVAGGIKLAPHLHRPWMRNEHFGWLASTERLAKDCRIPLIGANMAFSRRVLNQVPSFDVELGPGAKGHADDTLYSYQLEKAGYRIILALDTEAEHHLQETRLSRRSFAAQAKKRGEFNAYLIRHWTHSDPRFPLISLVRAWVALWARRLLYFRAWATLPTVPAWELRLLETWHTTRYFLVERSVPRKYEKFGLVKRDGAGEK